MTKINHLKPISFLIVVILILLFQAGTIKAQQNSGSLTTRVYAGTETVNQYIECRVWATSGLPDSNATCYFTDGSSNATILVNNYYIFAAPDNKKVAYIQGVGWFYYNGIHRPYVANAIIVIRYDSVNIAESTFRVTARYFRSRRLLPYSAETFKYLKGQVIVNLPQNP